MYRFQIIIDTTYFDPAQKPSYIDDHLHGCDALPKPLAEYREYIYAHEFRIPN